MLEARNKYTGEKVGLFSDLAKLARLRRRVRAWAKLLDPIIKKHDLRLVMITLTYAPKHSYEVKQITWYLQALKRHIKRTKGKLWAYAWVAELQDRGEVHYHIYLVVRKGTDIPRPDDSGMWPYGSSRIETGKTIWYLVGYANKANSERYEHKLKQKLGEFPKGLRMFAVWVAKDLDCSVASLWKFQLSAYPKWLRDCLLAFVQLVGLTPKPNPGGGYMVDVPPGYNGMEGGIIHFESPWEIVRD